MIEKIELTAEERELVEFNQVIHEHLMRAFMIPHGIPQHDLGPSPLVSALSAFERERQMREFWQRNRISAY